MQPAELDESVIVCEDTLETENYSEVGQHDLVRYLESFSLDERDLERHQSIYEDERDEETKRGACKLIPLDQEIKFIEYVRLHPNQKLKTLLIRFRWLNGFRERSIKRMRARALRDDRSRRLKLVELKSKLWQQFETARDKYLALCDFDLARWALDIAKQVGLDNFVASPAFISEFKKDYNISSRAITKIVTKRNILSFEERERGKQKSSFKSKIVSLSKKSEFKICFQC